MTDSDNVSYGGLRVVYAPPQCHGRNVLISIPCDDDIKYLIVDESNGKAAGYYCRTHAHTLAQARAVSSHLSSAFDYASTGKPERVTLILSERTEVVDDDDS